MVCGYSRIAILPSFQHRKVLCMVDEHGLASLGLRLLQQSRDRDRALQRYMQRMSAGETRASRS
jgi:hypothetical protein